MVRVLGKLYRVLALEVLDIPSFEGNAEFFNLVTGVVYIKFAPDIISRRLQNGGEAVAQRPAPGVAHMHGPGRVGGNKFDHDLLAFSEIRTPVLSALFEYITYHSGIKRGRKGKIEKARSRHLGRVEIRAVQNKMVFYDFGNHARSQPKSLGGNHGGV